MKPRSRFIPAVLAGLVLIPAFLPALTVNLAKPYDSKPSPPRLPGVTFYAPGAPDVLLTPGQQSAIIMCVPYQRALSLDWSLSHNMVKKPLAAGTVDPGDDNSFTITLPKTELVPGFYDLHVRVNLSESESLEASTTFGWDVDRLRIFPKEPKDFDAFWKEAVTSLDKVAPVPSLHLERTLHGKEIDRYNTAAAALPENYDPQGARFDDVEIYRVSFPSVNGRTIEGWFTKPVGAGPFPALLVLPGAGNNPRPAPVEHARHGYAALDIQVHGNPVDAAHYDALPPDDALDVRERLHYQVYLNALQGARVLRHLPGVDETKIAVVGGSQGGRLSLVVAALDPGIKAAVPAITHFAYRPWAWWVSRQNKSCQPGDGGFRGENLPEDMVLSDEYLDVVNFARRVRCPVLMNLGLSDPISPATSVYAAYRQIPGEKQLVILPNTGHDWAPAFDRRAWLWLNEKLDEVDAASR